VALAALICAFLVKFKVNNTTITDLACYKDENSIPEAENPLFPMLL